MNRHFARVALPMAVLLGAFGCGDGTSPASPLILANTTVAVGALRTGITVSCDCNGFRNHGQYVSCVTQAATDLQRRGEIAADGKGCITSLAAQSDCGKRAGATSPDFSQCAPSPTPTALPSATPTASSTPSPTSSALPSPTPGSSATPIPSPPSGLPPCAATQPSVQTIREAVWATADPNALNMWSNAADFDSWVTRIEAQLGCTLRDPLTSSAANTPGGAATALQATTCGSAFLSYCGLGAWPTIDGIGPGVLQTLPCLNSACSEHDTCYDGVSGSCYWTNITGECDAALSARCFNLQSCSGYSLLGLLTECAQRSETVCAMIACGLGEVNGPLNLCTGWRQKRQAECDEMPIGPKPEITRVFPDPSLACDCSQRLIIETKHFTSGAGVILRVGNEVFPEAGSGQQSCCKADNGVPEYNFGPFLCNAASDPGCSPHLAIHPFFTTEPDRWTAQVRNPGCGSACTYCPSDRAECDQCCSNVVPFDVVPGACECDAGVADIGGTVSVRRLDDSFDRRELSKRARRFRRKG